MIGEQLFEMEWASLSIDLEELRGIERWILFSAVGAF